MSVKQHTAVVAARAMDLTMAIGGWLIKRFNTQLQQPAVSEVLGPAAAATAAPAAVIHIASHDICIGNEHWCCVLCDICSCISTDPRDFVV